MADNYRLFSPTRIAACVVMVQAISVSRAVCALIFVCVAFSPGHELLALILFLYAAISDALDGAIARLFGVQTRGGGALDIACDKYLTVYSLFFLLAAGAPVIPICLALARDIFVQAFRSVTLDGRPILRPIRAIGLTVVIPMRFTVAYALILRQQELWLPRTVSTLCWICAVTSAAVLVYTLLENRHDLRRTFELEN